MVVEVRVVEALGEREIGDLANVLMAVVGDGASVGFWSPLTRAEAVAYWAGGLGPEVVLLVAEEGRRIVGTVQLHGSTKANGRHRAEVGKLLVSPECRRRGIGRMLMEQMEEVAREAGRTLLVLDTREGDASNRLYWAMGYREVGRIPGYTRSADGTTEATVIYYKNLA